MKVSLNIPRDATLNGLVSIIESHEFAVELGIASTRRLFRELLTSNQLVKELIELVTQDKQHISVILGRIRQIAAIDQDPEYTNPYDAALAAYLWSLRSKSVDQIAVAKLAAAEVLGIQDLWWARDIASEIVGEDDNRVSREMFSATFAENDRRFLAHPETVVHSITTQAQGLLLNSFIKDHPNKNFQIYMGKVTVSGRRASSTTAWSSNERIRRVRPLKTGRPSTLHKVEW